MRVIGGEFRSRRLKTIPGLATRPTPARLRETLFDVLAPRIQGVVFLDAYAGTGTVGIEALSRGAARCFFLENNPRAVELIRENLRSLGLEKRANVLRGPVLARLARLEADIVFLDPPYRNEGEYAGALDALGAREGSETLVIVQHSVRFDPGETHRFLRRTRLLKQGDNALSFYGALAARFDTVKAA
jgi:16S rRNA (guanine(966)-N(2))-methyltransferase RsmD